MGRRLYVGNLAYSVTKESLTEFFSKAGSVVSADIITDRMSGQSRGFGFVEMETDEQAQEAIKQLNSQTLGDRQIVVNEARENKRREGGGGGGRRFGGGGGGGRSHGGPGGGSGGGFRKKGGGNRDRF